MTRRIAPPLLALFLAACSGAGGSYPSLSPRPAEARSWAEPVSAPSVVVASPALDAQIAAARAELEKGGLAFDSADRRASPIVAAARGQAAGTERWIAAQSALAELDAQRAATSDAGSTIEELASTYAQTGQPDYPTLEAARREATALLDREAARIAALQVMIPAG